MRVFVEVRIEINLNLSGISRTMPPETCFFKFRKIIPEIIRKDGSELKDIYMEIPKALPECVDSEPYTYINGKSGLSVKSGKRWQHDVREAIDYLRTHNIISHEGKKWFINGFTDSELEYSKAEYLLEEENSGLEKTQLIESLRSISPKSSEYITVSGIRLKRDYDTIDKLKRVRDYRCQICGKTIPKKNGRFYIEAAHIKAKKEKGPETVDNLLILCPNHHKEFDYGDLKVIQHTTELIIFSLNGSEYNISLSL